MEAREETFVMSAKAKKWAFGLMGLGVILTVLGVLTYHGHNHHVHFDRLWANLLLNSVWFTGIALTGVFFVAVFNVSMSAWHINVKRLSEAMWDFLPVGFIGLLIVGTAGIGIYHWSHHGIMEIGDPHYDRILHGKEAWLNQPWFLIRMAIYFVGWYLLAMMIRKNSRNEDLQGGTKWYKQSIVQGSMFVVFFAITSSTAAWDWVMGLEPHWYSTMYGWYMFISQFVSFFAVMIILVILLQRSGYLKFVNDSHIHDLGKFLFAFSLLWMYLWFCQFMLIWYADIPEEAVYYVNRFEHFPVIQGITLVLGFICPFFIMMTRNAKRNKHILLFMSFLVLLAHYLDFFMMIMPGAVVNDAGKPALEGFNTMELGMVMLFAGIFIFITYKSLEKANLLPKNHPYMKESTHHQC